MDTSDLPGKPIHEKAGTWNFAMPESLQSQALIAQQFDRDVYNFFHEFIHEMGEHDPGTYQRFRIRITIVAEGISGQPTLN